VRAELIARRESVAEAQRHEWDLAISLKLLHGLPVRAGAIVGFCWPYRGEYDARHLLRRLREHGVRCALPVVRQRDEALVFRHWEPGVEMKSGALGIPYPVSTPQVAPDLCLVPLVGFGRAGDRLGYGGGYFDRTLASYAQRPLAVGIGYELARIETSFPQAHDILMDAIVTEAGMWRAAGGALEEVTATQLRETLQGVAAERERQARGQAHRLG
jgi:5-formyltetrahydrofolate cyclo-ligase